MAITNHTDATLVSAAMVRIGEQTVADLEDDNDRARTAKALYFQAKDWLLSIHPWQFNMALGVQLSRETATPTTRWTYQYTLPADRLSDDLRAVYSEAAVGALPLIDGFAVQNEKLYSDFTALWADYSQDKGEGSFPAYFSEALIALLSMQFANPVTDQQSTMDSFLEQLMGGGARPGVLAIAMNADARPGEIRTVNDAPFITSRFAGSGQWLG